MKTTFSRLFSSVVVILLAAQLLLGIFFQLMRHGTYRFEIVFHCQRYG